MCAAVGTHKRTNCVHVITANILLLCSVFLRRAHQKTYHLSKYPHITHSPLVMKQRAQKNRYFYTQWCCVQPHTKTVAINFPHEVLGVYYSRDYIIAGGGDRVLALRHLSTKPSAQRSVQNSCRAAQKDDDERPPKTHICKKAK